MIPVTEQLLKLRFFGGNMDTHNQNNNEELGYLFNIEVLVKDKTNALALQALLQLLNKAENVIDFRINSGIELGSIIESLLTAKKQTMINNSYKRVTANVQNKKKNPGISPASPNVNTKTDEPVRDNFAHMANNGEFGEWIQKYISENKLVRLSVIRNGERISLPCRILNFIPETYAINVYHVDEKQVYTFNLSEIIDFIES